MPFCHLHVHDEHSLLDGFGKAKQYVAEAKRLGQQYLALTNHGNVDGLIKFQKACLKEGIKPVMGVELYVVPDISVKAKGEKRYHITALIQSEIGLRNIFKMLSIGNLDGFYYRPRIDPSILMEHKEGLIFMTACLNSVVKMPDGIDLLLQLNKTNAVYLEIMPHNHPDQVAFNRMLFHISEKYGFTMVATNDCHYPVPKNAQAQEALLAIQRKAKWDDPNRWRFEITGLHLRSEREMLEAFQRQNVIPMPMIIEAMEMTERIAKTCDYKIAKQAVILPRVPGYEDRDESELLWEIIEQGWQERLASPYEWDVPTYQDRVNDEYDLICKQGFQRYFLIVWELIHWCKKNGIMTGPGRGSVGGSLVAFLMGITDVDPIKFDLIFARFISPERIDLPDIDMDFEDIHRGRVRQHLEECYGQYNVAGVSTFMTMKGKGSLRDVARVFDIPLQETDKAAKAVEDRLDGHPRANLTLVDACEDSKEVIEFQEKYPQVVDLATQLEGQARGCVSGESTVIVKSDNKLGFKVKRIHNLYKEKFQGEIRAYNFETDKLFFDEIEEIFYTGKQHTKKVIVKRNGHRKNHTILIITPEDKLLTKNGWISVSALNKNDIIATNGKQIPWNKGLTKDDHLGVAIHSERMRNNNPMKFESNKKALAERSYKHGAYTKQYQDYLITQPICEVCKVKPSKEVHHKDKNHFNNPPDGSNWEAVCISCHRKQDEIKLPLLSNQMTISWGNIISIEDYGVIDTYEIKMKSKNQNYICNKIIKHNSGQHAAAICISSDDLRDGVRCNLCNRKSILVANWDKGDAEYMGLMKLDVLGLSSLTVINYARQLIRKNYDVNIVFSKIKLDNKAVYDEINQGNNIGAFQIGSSGLISVCREMGVSEFSHIVLATALFRPGALGSGQTREFILRKQGRAKVEYLHPKLKPFTEESLGIIAYQEQVMWAMFHLAGLPWGVCDKVRKVMGKSKGAKDMLPFKEAFVNGCQAQKTLAINEAEKVWDQLSAFGGYGFNKAHSVEYSLISYWTMWLKVYYPKEFMCGLLTYGGITHKPEYIQEARRLGLDINLPKVGTSDAVKWTTTKTGNKIYAPFMEIKGIGQVQAEKISGKRASKSSGGMLNIATIGGKLDVSKATQEILEKIGAFSERELSPQEVKDAEKYFNFRLARDIKERYARIFAGAFQLDKPKENDLYTCNLPDINLIKIQRFLKKVNCNKCSLMAECREPVCPSIGRYNIMIAGEAPGIDEDREGIGFVGKAGDKILWPELKRYGLRPSMFHITNVCKCWPSKTKNPTKEHIEACRPIITEEIKGLQPILILAFGNTGVQLFKDQEGGITKLSGTTEWSDEFECWIAWCMHPASVLHNATNKQLFQEGIENFARKVDTVGGNYFRKNLHTSITGICPVGGSFSNHNNLYRECESCLVWDRCARAAAQEDWT